MKRSDYLLKNKINSAEPTVQNAEKRSDRLLKTPVKPPKPKKTTVTMRVGGEKMEVPQAFALAVKQTVQQNKQPFVLMENNLRAQKAAEDAYNKSLRNAMEFGGRLAPDEHETNMAELRALEDRKRYNEAMELTQNGVPQFMQMTRPIDEIIAQKKEAIESRADEDALSRYFTLRYNPDFAELSAYKTTKHGEVTRNTAAEVIKAFASEDPFAGDIVYSDTGYGDLAYDAINKNAEAVEIAKTKNTFSNLGIYADMARDYLSNAEREYMTEEEVAIFNYLYAKDKQNGTQDAYKFLELLTPKLNARYTEAEKKRAYAMAQEYPVESSFLNIVGTPTKWAPAILTGLDYAADGEVDTNSPYNRATHISSAERAGVSDLIEENAGGFWSGAYGIGMSAAENAYVGFLSGGSSTLAGAIMATTAFGDAVTSAKDRGLTSDQAVSLGFVTAGAELLTEKIGFDKAFDAAKSGGAKALAGAMVSNGLEEMSSEAITTIADVMIAKDKSEWQEKINKYKAQGFSDEEAFGKAFLDVAGEIGYAGIAGMASAGMIVGTSGIANAATNAYERAGEGRALGKEFRESNMTAEDMQAIISEGLATDPDSSSYKLAAKLQQKLDAGQPVSWTEYGKLYNENVRNVDSGFVAEESAVKPTVNVGSDDEKRKITPGFVRNEYSYDVSNKTIRALDAIGKKLGVEIEIGAPTGNTVDAYNGKYENGKITIARDAENPLEVVLSHEVTHHMQNVAPTEYAKFVELAVNASTKLSGEDKSALVEKYRTAYSEGTRTEFSEQAAIDEITADYAGKLVRDVSLFRNLVNADRNVAQRFVDGVKRFISSVKSTFSKDKKKADTASLEKYGATVSELEAAVKAYEGMIKDARAAVERGEVGADVTSTDAEIFGSVEGESSDEGARSSPSMTDELGNSVTTEVDGEGISHATIEDESGETVAQINGDGTASFSLKTYRESGKGELRSWLDNEVSENRITQKEADEITDQLEELYNICMEFEDEYATFGKWSEAEVIKGIDGNPLMSVIKANGDYNMNLDFSLVCKKRRTLDAVFKAMAESGLMDNVGELSEKQIATINNIIRTYGLETACTLCFVDSKRYRASKVANAFVEKYNSLVRMLAPKGTKIDTFNFKSGEMSDDGLHTMSDEELSDGIAKLRKVIAEKGEKSVYGRIAQNLIDNPQDRRLVLGSHFMDSDAFMNVSRTNPRVFTLYNSSKGSGGPKASLPDVQYLGEILKKSNFTPEKAYAVGGVRIQSFSDYIPRLVFDYLQMTADLAAKKLPAHAYTKEEMFVLQFGKTGIKINLSLVPAVADDGIAPGLDRNGNYLWADGHSFASDTKKPGSGNRGYQLAIQIQNADGYTDNVGTIAVGVSDKHIEKLLKDRNIRMVIPYHKSSLNKVVAQMGNIHKYADYTNEQSTRKWSQKKGKWLKFANKEFASENLKEFDFNEAFHRLGDAKAAANEYLAWCEENGYKPKFDRFAFHEDTEIRENYYKLLIDFAAYDSNGNATPQGAVRMNFPTQGDAFGSMKDLIESGLEEDAVLEGEREAAVPKILEEVKNTIGSRKSLKTGDLLSKDYKPRERAKAEVPSEVVISKKESAAPKTVTETRAVADETPKVAEAPKESDSYLEETGLVEAEAPPERAEARDEKLDDYTKRLEKHSRVIAEPQEVDEDDDPGAVYRSYVANPATEKKTLGEKVKESTSFVKRKFTNSGDAIRQIAKETKDGALYPAYNQARSSTNIAADMVSNKQTNIRGEKVGESLENILRPIKAKGKTYFNDFHLYLLHKHNIARMSIYNAEAEEAATNALLAFNREFPAFSAMSEDELNRNAKWDDEKGYRAREYIELRRDLRKAREQNKPVFYSGNGNPITAKTSERMVERFIKKYPEFKDYEKNVRTYLDNLMQYRIDSGLVTEDEAEYFRKKYPDYVPTYRATKQVMQQLSGRKDISKTLGRAKGGKIPFIPLDIALAEMTKKVVRNGQKNVFANKLYNDYEKSEALGKYMLDVAEMEHDTDSDIDAFGDETPITENTVSFYRNGSRIEFVATPDLYEAFDVLSKVPKEQPAIGKAVRSVNDAYKRLITSYDPTFVVRNGLKDLQDAIFNSRDAVAFLKNYPKAFREIATNGKMWQAYQAAGGLSSSRFEDIQEKGIKASEGALQKVKESLPFLNMMVEQAPRLAEFMAVLEKGDVNDADNIADALLAAAEVTTNFGESGTWGKVLNAYYIPFLNPAIQGTAQTIRRFTGTKTSKQWIGLVVKTAFMGLQAGFLNDLLMAIFGDDEAKEDYDNLDDRTKDNYYLFPIGDGNFLKLPKGRVTAALGIVADRTRDVAKSENVDIGEAFARIGENVLPENPLNNNILKAWFDADLGNKESKGRTWYGTDIENDSMQSLPVGERYDSSTDELSKWIGKTFNVSPKKVNYILKQYTGGVGRTILPMLTPNEQKGDNAGEIIGLGAVSMLTSSFTKDSRLSNKVSGEFYDAVTAAEQAKNSSKATDVDKVVYKYLNRARNNLGEYDTKIRKAESDENLTASGRRAAVRVATAERTAYQKSILENVDKYRESVEKYLDEYPGTDGDKRMEYAYNKANYEVYGPEHAIRADGSSTYKKYEEKVRRGKMTWEKAYDDYFGKSDRKYNALRDRFDISYDEFEKIAEAMSKNRTKEEEISAIRRLGYSARNAELVREYYNKAK